MNISKDSAKLACQAAIAAWCGNEWTYARELQRLEEVDEQWLMNWLRQWMLSRTAPKGGRHLLVALLNSEVRPNIVEASQSANAYEVVPRMATLLGEMRATKGRATSLVSKFASNLFPVIYSPYDSRARKGLQSFQRGQVRAHDYVAYMQTFLDFVVQFNLNVDQDEELKAIRRSASTFDLSDELFIRRASDKVLMLLGGFSVAAMARDIESLNSLPSGSIGSD